MTFYKISEVFDKKGTAWIQAVISAPVPSEAILFRLRNSGASYSRVHWTKKTAIKTDKCYIAWIIKTVSKCRHYLFDCLSFKLRYNPNVHQAPGTHFCHLILSALSFFTNEKRSTYCTTSFSFLRYLVCCWKVFSSAEVLHILCWARICKRLWSPGIDSEESISPGWESIYGLLKRSTNTSSDFWLQ
jgi:hypothetical protein